MKERFTRFINLIKIDRESFRRAVNCFLLYAVLHLAVALIFSVFISPTVTDMAQKENEGYRELALVCSLIANVVIFAIIGKYIMIFTQDSRRAVIESFRRGEKTVFSLVRENIRLIGYVTFFCFVFQLPLTVIHAIFGLPYKIMLFVFEFYVSEFIYYELTGLTVIGLVLMPVCTFAILAGLFALRYYIWKMEN